MRRKKVLLEALTTKNKNISETHNCMCVSVCNISNKVFRFKRKLFLQVTRNLHLHYVPRVKRPAEYIRYEYMKVKLIL